MYLREFIYTLSSVWEAQVQMYEIMIQNMLASKQHVIMSMEEKAVKIHSSPCYGFTFFCHHTSHHLINTGLPWLFVYSHDDISWTFIHVMTVSQITQKIITSTQLSRTQLEMRDKIA